MSTVSMADIFSQADELPVERFTTPTGDFTVELVEDMRWERTERGYLNLLIHSKIVASADGKYIGAHLYDRSFLSDENTRGAQIGRGQLQDKAKVFMGMPQIALFRPVSTSGDPQVGYVPNTVGMGARCRVTSRTSSKENELGETIENTYYTFRYSPLD